MRPPPNAAAVCSVSNTFRNEDTAERAWRRSPSLIGRSTLPGTRFSRASVAWRSSSSPDGFPATSPLPSNFHPSLHMYRVIRFQNATASLRRSSARDAPGEQQTLHSRSESPRISMRPHEP